MALTNEKIVDPPRRIMASYGMGKFVAEFFGQAFGVIVFFYYEVVLGLDSALAALGFIIYSVYNAINDPLIGYLTEKKTTRFTDKYGRRTPWIIIGTVLYCFSFIIIFLIPDFILNDASSSRGLYILIWMVISTCIYDTLYSLWDVSYQSLFPDKFRSNRARNITTSLGTVVGVIGIALGFILPTAFTDPEASNAIQTYIDNAIIFTFIGLFFVILLLPSIRENKGMIERFLKDREEKKDESFFGELKKAFRERNFIAWIVMYLFYQSAVVSITASVEYIGNYITKESTTIIFVGYLGGALIAIYVWFKLFSRIGSSQRVMMITATIMAISALPMALPMVNTTLMFTFFAFCIGLGFGGYWMIMTPALSDVIDEIVIKTGKRNDGIFMGFRAFFGRLAFGIQAISFATIHILTGFINDPNATQPESAILGIHIHLGLIPAILLISGVIIFWILNTLTPEKIAENKQTLKEMNI